MIVKTIVDVGMILASPLVGFLAAGALVSAHPVIQTNEYGGLVGCAASHCVYTYPYMVGLDVDFAGDNPDQG